MAFEPSRSSGPYPVQVPEAAEQPPLPIGFAHRGARSERPENTIAAFARALELGATGLESDAWITADGVVVLDHDGVTGPVWRRRAISAQARGELPDHIPSLEDLFHGCGAEYELSLDVKDPAALEGIVGASEAAGITTRLWLCHHDWRLLAGWKSRVGGAHLVESTRVSWMSEGLGPRAHTLKQAGIDALNLHRGEWDPGRVADVHGAGLYALGWDAQSADDISRLLDLGLDGIYSDHVGRMMAGVKARLGPRG